MADEQDKDQKTEEASPRRLQEARSDGQVALSTELVAALALCAGVAVMSMVGGQAWRRVASILVATLENLPERGKMALDVPLSARWLQEVLSAAVLPLALFVAPVLVVMLLTGYGQVGFQLAPKAIQFDPNKVNPAKGFSRLFSTRAVVRTALALAKVLAVGGAMVLMAWRQVPGVVSVGTAELGPLLVALGVVALRCTAAALLVILILAVVDFFFQRWQFKRDLRMSKEEVKEEHKLTDGDPRVKARIRRIQVELATSRMMADVPKATVVVTNPTHFAVALRYEREEGRGAPLVLAKGAGHVALRIKHIAAEAGILCHEDVPLARALYRQAEVGREIPEELFAAVAAVLAHVYRLREEPRALRA